MRAQRRAFLAQEEISEVGATNGLRSRLAKFALDAASFLHLVRPSALLLDLVNIMSLFGLGGGSSPAASNAAVSSAQIEAATAELEMVTDVFNRLVSSCHAKCISTRYAEPDLNKGESICIDR